MGQTLRVARRMDLATAMPRNALASSRYCLANPGVEYLVYLPEGGDVTVDLSESRKAFSARWLNVATGAETDGASANGGGQRRFTAPLKGDAVLHLLVADG